MGDAHHDRPPVSTELVGLRIMERYLLTEKIARGGMSVVYRGEDERLRRPVCVKVFCGLEPSRPAYRTVHEHFVQEAFALSALHHPNTIRIFDFGYLDDELATPFFVVEYADGGTLKEFVRKQGPLTLAQTIEILEPIVGALREAHGAGIIHRDIKPSNLLFSHAGPSLVIKLADFSIAKAIEDAIPNRADDTNLGGPEKIGMYSLGWAAPEQLQGERVGPSADVFALGLTTAFMLSGKVVYPGEDVLQLFELRRLGDTYLRRALIEQGLDDDVTRVLANACRSQADERFQSVETFLEALRESADESWRNITTRHDLAAPPRHQVAAATAGDPAGTESVPPRDPGQVAGSMSNGASSASVPPQVVAPVLTLGSFAAPEIVVGGRRIRSASVIDELTLGDDAGIVSSRARIRVTPRDAGGQMVHIKGLNCFVCRDAGRPTSGVDVDGDCELIFISAARDVIERIAITVGFYDGYARTFQLQGAALAVPLKLADWAVILDLGPGRETLLLYRPVGGRP